MRSRFFAALFAVFGLGVMAAAATPAAAHDCCSSCCGQAYIYEGAVGHRYYAPTVYREAYYSAYTSDRFAYRYARPSYYPYYNSGYWRPTRELRYRAAYLHPYPPLPRYYPAWGYPNRHVVGHHGWRRSHAVHAGFGNHRSWRARSHIVPAYRRYGYQKASFRAGYGYGHGYKVRHHGRHHR